MNKQSKDPPAYAGTTIIPVPASACHVHLSTQTLAALYGLGHPLHVRTAIHQLDQYACEEAVGLIGPKGRIDGVRVVGPIRSPDQVEISAAAAIATTRVVGGR